MTRPKVIHLQKYGDLVKLPIPACRPGMCLDNDVFTTVKKKRVTCKRCIKWRMRPKRFSEER